MDQPRKLPVGNKSYGKLDQGKKVLLSFIG